MDKEIIIILSQLTDSQVQISEIIGIENYIKLIKLIDGDTIYIPKYDGFFQANIDEEIRRKFNGYNYKELAKEYNLTVKTIYNKIPKDIRKTRKVESSNLDGQLSF